MSIKRKLILSPSLVLVTFLIIVAISWFSGLHLTEHAKVARAFERQAMHLQMLMRGINETLLTRGSPSSIELSKQAIQKYEETHHYLMSAVHDERLVIGLKRDVEIEWSIVKPRLEPFLRENDVDIEDSELMAAYGELMFEAEHLLEDVQGLANDSQLIAEEVAQAITMVVAITVTSSLVGLIILFFKLYSAIAQPMGKLKTIMQRISRAKHDLVADLDRGSKELGGIEDRFSAKGETDNEISSLANASRVMLYGIRNHLVSRRKAENELSEMNKHLEKRVEERTLQLNDINKNLREQIKEREKGEQELRFAAGIFDETPDGIMVTDAQNRILRVNESFTTITGFSREEVLGSLIDVLSVTSNIGDFRNIVETRLRDRDFWQGELHKQRKSEEPYSEWCKLRAIRNEEGEIQRYVYILTDITEQKRLEQQLHQLAHYDNLTNLPNRALFQKRLKQALFQTHRRGRGMAVLFLDLDHFKFVNDSLGHHIGDRLLEVIAQRLKTCLREDDIVARLGGDEFTILLRDVNSPDDITRAAYKIINKINEPIGILEHEIQTGTSIGISVFPADGDNVETLLRNADTAMYRAKKDGKGVVRFFTSEMNTVTQRRLAIETGLHKAIDKNEFSLNYQPQVDLNQGKLFGVEVLLRWNNDKLGFVPPDEFIPIAEETNQIVEIGKWVIEQACAQYKIWKEAGCAPERMGLNLSPRQLAQPMLVQYVSNVLNENNISPSVIDLEITETAIMDNPERSIATLTELTELGIRSSIDDFGIEYSAMNQLKRLPIDMLKIDRSFVKDIPDDIDDMAITAAIIAMAETFGLSIIAEGVETKEQIDFLVEHKCHLVQGYYFSKPLPASELEPLLISPSAPWNIENDQAK